MKNGDIPAMPVPIMDNCCTAHGTEPTYGLTKREMFAMAAMQGLLADPNVLAISAVNVAVECADLLLRRLDGEDINPYAQS